MSREFDLNRRRFVGMSAISLVAAPLGFVGSSNAQAAEISLREPALFGPIKQINAGLLNVGYAEAGPSGGPPVILLHE